MKYSRAANFVTFTSTLLALGLTNTRPTHSFILPSSNVLFGTKNAPSMEATVMHMAKKQGFGKNVPKKRTPPSQPPVNEMEANPIAEAQPREETTSSLGGGKDALARLRRAEAEKRNEELRAVRDLKDVDDFLVENPDAAVIPEKVAMRMGKRMLPFVGVPLFGSLGSFVAFWYFATQKDIAFQPTLVAFSTIFILIIGLLGITYSVMSASWDPEIEGSTLGFAEVKKNIESLQDGFKRSRQSVLLREKMAGLPEEEITMAIRNLERQEKKEVEEKMSLEEKMEKNLD
eukprot:CAMPEP_0197832920 /NCGR_PEP_ID=MMETSP1437-20131217/16881_1 /TAXON_ID=49252 ORGANISM="Eucampia antarctica, Strain CCMP1452" /NCGR_SAMPLE_ID=MMETSP1437 /ASSEMBLY_ACC=CAM_ASM_001096 /LENGTH=287 /DNA_ID=CAMNT_0043436585 /DNA_START=18 /DNA_END=881 /DNA_ORIENTATION=+